MANQIVTVNVSVSAAPAPATLQQTGAFISQGATTKAAQTLTLITQMQDLTNILAAPLALTSLTWASGTVTATTTAALPVTFESGKSYPITIAGATPSGYNGQYLATITGTDTFTYALATNPGTETAAGTYTVSDVLNAMATTFFAQGSQQSVYVLELGASTATTGVSNLQTFITANPNTIYSYLVPRAWDGNSAYLAFLANFESTTSKTYFFTTTTTGTYTDYTALMKDVVPLVEAPAIPLTEFSLAGPFWKALSYNPSGTNRVTPFAFSFMYGVTAYPTVGNATQLASLKAANINYIGTGAEGGLTNTILFWGTTADGNDFSYWYSVDWIQINLDLNISNAIINGSNNPINPLYYTQDGINRLQDVSVATIQTAITDGMAIGSVARTGLDATTFQQQVDAGTFIGQDVVNAIPFLTYTTANPTNYQSGIYNGLSAYYIPARGFKAITFNVNVTDFLTQ